VNEEQVNEEQASLYIHFVDSEKAFEPIHKRSSLWMVMKHLVIHRRSSRLFKKRLTSDLKSQQVSSKAVHCPLTFPVHSVYRLDDETLCEDQGTGLREIIYIEN